MTQVEAAAPPVTTRRTAAIGPSGGRRRLRLGAGGNGLPLRGLLPLVLLLVIWQVSGGSQPNLPPPSTWWSALRELNSGGLLLPAIGQTLESFAIALVVATAIGASVGYGVGRSRLADRALGPTLEFLRFTPSAAIIPVVVLLVGYEERAKVVVVVLGSVWPILLQTRQGARGLSAESLDLARSLRMGAWRRFTRVQLPLLLPAILLGVRIASPISLIMVLLVEVTTSVPGIGSLIASAQQTFTTSAIFGLIALSAVISFVINIVIGMAAGYLTRHRR